MMNEPFTPSPPPSPPLTPVDDAKWHHQTLVPNGVGWYNHEVQLYTDAAKNSYVAGGSLHVRVLQETVTVDGVTKGYSSARLNSKYAFQYGSVRVRAKMPTAHGLWPAIWTLGQNISERGAYWQTQGYGTTSWPACGEIDIMEHWTANGARNVSCALHVPASHGATDYFHETFLPEADPASEFHVYGMNWTSEHILFFVDGEQVYRYAPTPKTADNWPFDAPQFLLLNVAVQSSAGTIADDEGTMEVDYVRVYDEDGVTLAWSDEFD